MTIAESMTDDDVAIYRGLEGLQPAPDPGLRTGDILQESVDPEAPSSVSVKGLDGKDIGYVYLYHRDGTRRTIKRDIAAATLGRKMPDGSPAFSNNPWPGVTAFRGQVKCLLHPEHPNRQLPSFAGFPFCMSAHLASEYERDRHMRMRHHSEWEAVNASEIATDRQMERAAWARMAEAPQQQPAAEVATKEAHYPTKKCDSCGAFFFQQKQVDRHVAEVHAPSEG